ncbi:predicted protein [Lichtheimia corymbifera JMRC:FSU:9682]|uniref:BZIP domain-containing protein n=1 Tax=Lichtheimia corymbifera JMRC:FSU:9682 TaxID=1263082 RepID=A0A068S8T3_9FUNG|nr:predicted protein [Lichtheimia corymbifera JMRC:FSU:9682]
MAQYTASSFPTQPFLANDIDPRQWDNINNQYAISQQQRPFQKEGSEDNSEEDSSSVGKTPGADKSDSKQKRKEQNRAAQRAFRERKERYVKELEEKIKTLQENHASDNDRLQKENDDLRATIKRMESEMYTLKGAAMAFEMSISKLREAGIEPPSIGSFNCALSPPSSDLQCLATPSSSHDTCNNSSNGSVHHPMSSPSMSCSEYQQRRSSCDDMKIEHVDEFAESASERFDHTPDPVTLTNAKLIPCAEVWDHLNEHPRFDDFDVAKLCEAIKKNSKCSGSGPVIEEEVLKAIVKRQLGEVEDTDMVL